MLERNVAFAPTLSRAEELAVLYRQQGREQDELELLRRFETELTSESGLVLRLAHRLVAVGDLEAAIRVLSRTRQSPAPGASANQDERLLLAELLAKSGHGGVAARLARQWVLEWRQPWLATQVLRILARNAATSDAAEVAEAVVQLHPEIRLFLVHELAASDAKPVAAHLLETWARANASATMDEMAGFLTACRELDEPALVWRNFGEVLGGSAPDTFKARFSEAMVAEFGIASLAPFWARLPRAALEGNPLLLARLAFHEQNLPLAKLLLDRVEVAALPALDRQMWLGLLNAVASPVEVFEVLRRVHRRGGLPHELLLPYARLAGGLGQEIDYRAAVADLQ
jgi:hypothetical protein